MIGFQTARCGVYIPLPCSIMGVKAVFAGTAAREMLGGYGHAVSGHALRTALNPGNDMGHDLADKCRVFAKGAVGALPAGVGHRVGHVHVALAQAAGVPFPAHRGGKLVHKVDAAALDCSGNAQRSRPCGQHAAGIVHAKDQLAVLIAGVGRSCHRDKMLALLTDSVGLVHPVGHVSGGGIGAQDHMAVEPLLQ